MSAREGREGDGGKGIEDKETKGGEERMLRREGEGRRNNRTIRAFFILHCFHCNLIVELIKSLGQINSFLMFQPKAGVAIPGNQPGQDSSLNLKKTGNEKTKND